MEDVATPELVGFLECLPPVEFCCIYGSSLHSYKRDKSSMVDFMIGVSDPLRWHCENLKLNGGHYSSYLRHFGGEYLITQVAEKIGVGVHFNPFVPWKDKMIKYGVVGMDALVKDILGWDRFYLCGRLQKPVRLLVDNLDIENVNATNLRAAISAALLLLPSQFNEEELYSKICSLSYMGDLRVLFAEDKHKVKKIVDGQFDVFRSTYKPFLQELESKNVLCVSSSGHPMAKIYQDHHHCSSATRILVSSLPPRFRCKMEMKLTKPVSTTDSGQGSGSRANKSSREEAARCVRQALSRRVMISSVRQAVSGFLAVGSFNAGRYLGSKLCKAWQSFR